MRNKNQRQKPEGFNFLDVLSEQSLDNLKRFGYIFRSPKSGHIRIRTYKKLK